MLQVIITYDYLSGFSLLDFCTQKYKTNSKISHLYDKKDGIIGTCVLAFIRSAELARLSLLENSSNYS